MQPQQNPYDFIVNPNQPPKKQLLPTPKSKTQRIVFVAIGGGILLVVILAVFALIFSSGGGNEQQLLSLAQRHSELVRVANIGTEKARGPEARHLAATTKLALQSSRSELLTVINKQTEVGSAELRAGQNPETDQLLTTAEQRNRFDEEFVDILSDQLRAYQLELKSVYDSSTSETSRQVYSNIFNQVSALLSEEESS